MVDSENTLHIQTSNNNVSLRYCGWGGLFCGEQHTLESRKSGCHTGGRDPLPPFKIILLIEGGQKIGALTTLSNVPQHAKFTERRPIKPKDFLRTVPYEEIQSLQRIGKPTPCWIFDVPNVAYNACLLLTFYSIRISRGVCPVSSPPVNGTLHR